MGLFDPAAHALGLFQFCVQVSMRPGSFLLSLAVCLALTGCTSSSGIDEILARPSMEVTSSIAKPDKTMVEQTEKAGKAKPAKNKAAKADKPRKKVTKAKSEASGAEISAPA